MIKTILTLSTVLRCALIPLMFCSPIGDAGQKVSDTNTRLASCRKQIDETDQQIVALLNQRARIVAEIGRIKEESHLPVAAPAREQQVLDHVVKMRSSGPLPPDHLRRIYQTIVQEMRIWEEELSRERTDKSASRPSDQR
jgi:chorismate mutase